MFIGVFFLGSFLYHYIKYSKFFASGYGPEMGNMLSLPDFYGYWGFYSILLGIILSFFINNKKLKWISILILVLTFFIIFMNVGKFNVI